jgi:hypothetical protein
MARPRKGRSDSLTEILRCRMRPVEYFRVRRAAVRANMSLSEYARHMLLSGRLIITERPSVDPALFDQLRRIGINLNQAVHRLNATGEIPDDLASAAAKVETFLLGIMKD